MSMMDVDTPSMHRLDPRALKRQLSRNAEESEAKRNYFGTQRYADIVYELVQTFTPLMRMCHGFEEFTLSKKFTGINSEGRLDDKMELLFVGYSFNPSGSWVDRSASNDGYEGDGEQSKATPNRKHYRVAIRLLDRSGFVPTRRLMERLNIPPAIDVQCGMTSQQLYDTIVDVAVKWLDFVSDQFKLARVPRNRVGA
jgi:hypothetical protein